MILLLDLSDQPFVVFITLLSGIFGAIIAMIQIKDRFAPKKQEGDTNVEVSKFQKILAPLILSAGIALPSYYVFFQGTDQPKDYIVFKLKPEDGTNISRADMTGLLSMLFNGRTIGSKQVNDTLIRFDSLDESFWNKEVKLNLNSPIIGLKDSIATVKIEKETMEVVIVKKVEPKNQKKEEATSLGNPGPSTSTSVTETKGGAIFNTGGHFKTGVAVLSGNAIERNLTGKVVGYFNGFGSASGAVLLSNSSAFKAARSAFGGETKGLKQAADYMDFLVLVNVGKPEVVQEDNSKGNFPSGANTNMAKYEFNCEVVVYDAKSGSIQETIAAPLSVRASSSGSTLQNEMGKEIVKYLKAQRIEF